LSRLDFPVSPGSFSRGEKSSALSQHQVRLGTAFCQYEVTGLPLP
jgi:hypothetical protein